MAVSTSSTTMAVSIPPNAPQHVYAAAAEQALAWGKPEGALEVCELGLSRHPAYAGLRLFRAEALLTHSRHDEAEADLRAVLAAEPQHPRALKVLCYLLMQRHRFREALHFLELAEFVIRGDRDIETWLVEASKHADDEPPPPPAVPDLLSTPVFQERMQALASLAGVHTVLVERDGKNRLFGPDRDVVPPGLAAMPALETEMSGVLEEAGFGALADVTLDTPKSMLSSHRGAGCVLRVAADAGLREGLVAWHAAKALEEEA